MYISNMASPNVEGKDLSVQVDGNAILQNLSYEPEPGKDSVGCSLQKASMYLSYAMPLLMLLISYFSGTHQQLSGPWAMTPIVSLAVNVIGLMYLLFACITFNIPSVYPVTGGNMNYRSAAVGEIMFLITVTWFTAARKHLSGRRWRARMLL